MGAGKTTVGERVARAWGVGFRDTDRDVEEQDRTRSARIALDTLTERERDVADGVARGLSNADIAAELYMGVPTVKTHVGRLFTKLGVENRVQVAILVHDAQA
jgi:DNA-binding NarL/FixJ family response regulator